MAYGRNRKEFFDRAMQVSEKDKLREEFELKSQNIVAILSKKTEDLIGRDRDLLQGMLKKVQLIQSSFDINCETFRSIHQHLEVLHYPERQVLFRKGDPGQHFYIVLYGRCFVQAELSDNGKLPEKRAEITYYPGDSFGEISLIYNVPRGATVATHRQTILLRLEKKLFMECTRFEKKLLEMNTFFREHPYMDMAEDFIIRVFSSSSTRERFREGDVLIPSGRKISFLLFLMSGKAKLTSTISFESGGKLIEREVELQQLSKDSVFGEYFLVSGAISTVTVTAIDRGEYAKVHLQEDIKSSNSVLSKRIMEAASRFPTDSEIFEQYRLHLYEQHRKAQAVLQIYPDNQQRRQQAKESSKRYKEVMEAKHCGNRLVSDLLE